MLILSRLKNETIRIDGPVTLTVTEIIGGKVKLGFEGPGRVVRGNAKCTVAGGRLSPDSPGAAASHNQE